MCHGPIASHVVKKMLLFIAGQAILFSLKLRFVQEGAQQGI